ncbi:MAG: hypothetical protein V3575_00465 [Candidatus Absconditabacteria bacterium]
MNEIQKIIEQEGRGKSKGILNGIKKGLIDILGSEDEKYFVRQLGIDSDDYRLLKLILKMLNNRNYKGLGPKESNNYTWKDLREYVRIKDGKIESLGDLLPYTMPIDISKEDKGFQERMLGRTIISENEDEIFGYCVEQDEEVKDGMLGKFGDMMAVMGEYIPYDLRGANIEKQLAFIKKLEAGDYKFHKEILIGGKVKGIEKILELKTIKVKQLQPKEKTNNENLVITTLDLSGTDIKNLGNLIHVPGLNLNGLHNFEGFEGVKVVEGWIRMKDTNLEAQIDLLRRLLKEEIDVYGQVTIVPNKPGLEKALEGVEINTTMIINMKLDLRGMPMETQKPFDELVESGKLRFMNGYESDNVYTSLLDFID